MSAIDDSDQTNIQPAEPSEIAHGYNDLLRDIKARIQTAQVRVAQSVNSDWHFALNGSV